MEARNFALISGILFGLIGILGFVPLFVSAPDTVPDVLAVRTGFGYLMGLFPINILHNLVHLAVGVLGFLSSRSFKGSLVYCQGLSIFYGLLAVMGLMPVSGTSFGLIPIFGHDVWLHLGTAAIAGYYGFVKVPNAVEAVRDDQRAKSMG